MEAKDIISIYEQVIIQIATPYSTGTGFYISQYGLIVTNEHVVRSNKKVVIAGKNIEKQLADVIYLDTKYDLAFIKIQNDLIMTKVLVGSSEPLYEGNKVYAIGHPFGLKFTATQGIISSLLHQEEDVHYIQHDAALNPGNSGGPLVDSNGTVIGINTFIIQNGNSIGFSLPVSYLLSCAEDFRKGNGAKGVRCPSCNNISFEKEGGSNSYCAICGAAITMISDIEDYQPYGVSSTVEDMISKLGYQVDLARKGPNNWSLKKGSAELNISYYEKTGLLLGDIYMCTLPDSGISELYQFLLMQNYNLKGMSFSLREQDIILSLLIYDQYLNGETMYKLFKNLLITADMYDNIIVDTFGGKWKNRNS